MRGRLSLQWLVVWFLFGLLFYSNDKRSVIGVGVVAGVACFQPTTTTTTSSSIRIQQTSFILPSKNVTLSSSSSSSSREGAWRTLFRSGSSSSSSNRGTKVVPRNLRFNYDYYVLTIGNTTISRNSSSGLSSVRGILLVHPIGIGIAKWYYERLLVELQNQAAAQKQQYLVVVPDLLGCGSACNAILLQSPDDCSFSFSSVNQTTTTTTATTTTNRITRMRHPPLLTITDWSAQLFHVMSTAQQQVMPAIPISDWCIVADTAKDGWAWGGAGGYCTSSGTAPIALHVAAQSVAASYLQIRSFPNVSQVILSSSTPPPPPPFFSKRRRFNIDPARVNKSYQILCGITGQFFWWYACHQYRRFSQQQPQKLLLWRRRKRKRSNYNWILNRMIATATAKDGKSRYATFSVLAGTLQDECILTNSLETLKLLLLLTPGGTRSNHFNSLTIRNVTIDFITGGGGDTLHRDDPPAKSWLFWKKKKRRQQLLRFDMQQQQQQQQTQPTPTPPTHLETTLMTRESFWEYVAKHGNGCGREIKVDGGMMGFLAQEEAAGYAAAVLELLMHSNDMTMGEKIQQT